MRRGTLFVLAGPSGVGKGSVVERLRSRDPERLALSVSATTRPARPGEQDGVEYLFVDDATFDAMVADGRLLEWAEVFAGRRYGTPRGFVEEQLASGRIVIDPLDEIRVHRQVLAHVDFLALAQVRRHLEDQVPGGQATTVGKRLEYVDGELAAAGAVFEYRAALHLLEHLGALAREDAAEDGRHLGRRDVVALLAKLG